VFTLATLVANQWLTQRLSQNGAPRREFYYVRGWKDDVEALPGEVKTNALTRDVSARGRVVGLVERFVRGDLAATLVTPIGDGMDPPFKRLRRPDSVVVEMRTEKTRSFGFFARPNCYVAVSLRPASFLKVPNSRALYAAEIQKTLALLALVSPTDIDRTTDDENLVTDDLG
jgi:hypothetical protein